MHSAHVAAHKHSQKKKNKHLTIVAFLSSGFFLLLITFGVVAIAAGLILSHDSPPLTAVSATTQPTIIPQQEVDTSTTISPYFEEPTTVPAAPQTTLPNESETPSTTSMPAPTTTTFTTTTLPEVDPNSTGNCTVTSNDTTQEQPPEKIVLNDGSIINIYDNSKGFFINLFNTMPQAATFTMSAETKNNKSVAVEPSVVTIEPNGNTSIFIDTRGNVSANTELTIHAKSYGLEYAIKLQIVKHPVTDGGHVNSGRDGCGGWALGDTSWHNGYYQNPIVQQAGG
ncbi:Uncharacterised protein [uncultured archaeon]|nr:Uncharacterised protein [uncultured archaeon]